MNTDHIRVIMAISSEINPVSPAGKMAHYPRQGPPPPLINPFSRTGTSLVM